jgi:serine/threonine-protein kinase
MEFLVGQSLEDLVKRGGPLPVADAIDLMLEALEAIAEAHAIGLVHRDLKPSNLFLAAREGHGPIVKVLDFGIVKDLADHASLTTRGTLPGTPAYMAPEQVMLQSDKIDARADVWALGVTLYQVLTGGLPFAGPMRTMLTRIRSEAAPRLRSRRQDVPLELEEIVDRCLAKAPESRYPTAAELGHVLEDFRRRGLGRTVRGPAPTVRKSDGVLPRTDADTSSAVVLRERRRGRGRSSNRWLILLVCTSIACVLVGMLLAMRAH